MMLLSASRTMSRAALARLAAPGLILSLAAVLAVAAGCEPKSRFASGSADPLGAQINRGHFPPSSSDVTGADKAPAAATGTAAVPRLERRTTVAGLRVPAAWVPRYRERPWQYIVIHHSATHGGGAAEFDKGHRANGWDELGYHFVIGNGTDTPSGTVEVGTRWPKQKHGAHAKTPDNRFNDYGIGVCLVGHFDNERPSAEQLQSLATLVAFLMHRYDIPANRVIGHGDTKPTACPGRALYAQLPAVRRVAANAVARGVFDSTNAGGPHYAVSR